MEVLVYCPFCGMATKLTQAGYRTYFIECTNCHARGPNVIGEREDAIEFWNKKMFDCSKVELDD